MIGAVRWVFNCIESNIELLDYGLKEHAHEIDVLSIAMKVNEATFRLSTALCGKLDVGNGLVLLG